MCSPFLFAVRCDLEQSTRYSRLVARLLSSFRFPCFFVPHPASVVLCTGPPYFPTSAVRRKSKTAYAWFRILRIATYVSRSYASNELRKKKLYAMYLLYGPLYGSFSPALGDL